MTAPESKKPKLAGLFDLVFPPAPSGAISASRSAAIAEDEHKTSIQIKDVNEESFEATFFPEDFEDSAPPDIGANVKKQLIRSNIKEEILRNAVFTDLQLRHSIQFPESSRTWLSAIATRTRNISLTTIKFDHRYKEQSLADLLNEFHATLTVPDAAEDAVAADASEEEDAAEEPDAEEPDFPKEVLMMPERILRGLLVTTTSKPDMTVIRGKDIFFGEFKNATKYSTENAAKQCALYLFALLYFFRVRLARPVRAVFGFFVCGCGCFRQPIYVVGLVKLSVPLKLGQSMKCQVFQKTYNTNDLTGMQLLVNFLRCGRTVEEGKLKEKIKVSDRIPAFLTLPENLWNSPHLVKNGTTSMVFRGSGEVILDLLNQIDGNFEKVEFLEFLDYICAKKGNWVLYLKIRLKDTTLRSHPADTICDLWNTDDHDNAVTGQLTRLYCVKPQGTSKLGVFLMNDCGTVLHQAEKSFLQLTAAQFLGIFGDLWRNTMALTNYLFHGDALVHNFVYDEKEKALTLIDLDEGVQDINVPKRVVESSELLPNPYLRYPNYLRSWSNREIYTGLQLGASFLLMITHFEARLDKEQKELLGVLRGSAPGINGYLQSMDDTDPRLAITGGLPDSLKNFISTLSALLSIV